MTLRIALAAFVVWVTAAVAPFLPPRALSLGGPEKWQYLVLDAPGQRLYIAHGTEITVVDTAGLSIAGRVQGLSGAHGVALVPGGHGYADSGRAATISVFDQKTFQVLATLKADVDAYAVIYDPASRRVFVMNDDAGNVTVVDPATDHVVATIPTGPGLESAAADGQGHLFVAHSEAHQVLRIDTARLKVDAAWPVRDCGTPHGLALDTQRHRVFVSCPEGRLAVLDGATGTQIAGMAIGLGSDTLLFDAARHRILSPNASGNLSIVDETETGDLRAEPPLPIPPGTKTGALDPATGRLFLVAADLAHVDPPKDGGEGPRYRFVPGTVRLLAYDPAPRP